jgi:hypothetical protein
VAKKSATFRENNFRSHIYSTVLRKKKFEIFFCKTLLIHIVYIIIKKFEKIYFKYLKIAIKADRSNLFAPTVLVCGSK